MDLKGEPLDGAPGIKLSPSRAHGGSGGDREDVPEEIYFRGVLSAKSSKTSSVGQNEELQTRSQLCGSPRIFNTLNFVPSRGVLDEGAGESDFLWLDNVSPTEQEHYLLQDLIYILGGTEGELITISPDQTRGLRFVVNPRVQQSLRDLTLQIAQLGIYFSVVTAYMERHTDMDSGRVNQALAASIRDIVKEYLIMICQLETYLINKELTLQKMWFYIQPSLQTFSVINSLVTEIEDEGLRGGPVLSAIHEKATTLVADENLFKLCQNLAQNASEPYFAMLENWIYKGTITDRFKEFLIIDNDVADEKLAPNDNYWEKRYIIDESKCPSFLKKKMMEILKAGKYLNVIRETGKEINVVTASKIIYSVHERVYATAIDNACSFASRTLLDLLMNENDLMRRLLSVKHYLLMDQGDFIVQFLDLAEDELSKEMDDINPVRLESLLELALRTSSLSADPYKDNVSVQLFPYGISDQLWDIMTIETPLEAKDAFDNLFTHSNYSIPGAEAFSFTYEVQWPVSLVLNARAITCYQMIFRHLFYCKHVERQLCKVWIENKVMKKLRTEEASGMAQIYDLRLRMLHFVQNTLYYMAFEVIEPTWHTFLTNMAKVTNVDQVISWHFELLSSILSDSMLINRSCLSKMTNLLSICLKFAEKLQTCSSLNSKNTLKALEGPIKEIATQFDKSLVEFLREVSNFVQDPNQNQSSKVSNIIYRLNFNGFYTEALEKYQSGSGSSNSK